MKTIARGIATDETANGSDSTDVPADSGPTKPAASPWRWGDWAAVFLLVALAATARYAYADRWPSFDELWHLALSAGRGNPVGYFDADVVYTDPVRLTSTAGAPAFLSVWTHMDGVLHPPLYVLVLRLWRDAFGDGDLAAQSLSFAFGAIAVGFQFATVRVATGRFAACLVGVASALAPTQAYFGQEIRGYAMLVAIGSVGLYLLTLVEVFGPTRRRMVGLAIVAVALVYTHYFGAGAAACIAGYGLWRAGPRRKTFVKALEVVAVLYAATWLPFALRQAQSIYTGDSFLLTHGVGYGHEFFLTASAPLQLLVDRRWSHPSVGWAFGLLFVLPWLAARRVPALWPWCAWLCASVIPLLVLDLVRSTRHMEFIRYQAVASAAVLPLIVGTAAAVDRRLGLVAGGALACICGSFFWSRQGVLTEVGSFGRSGELLAKGMSPGEGLITYDGRMPDYFGDVLMLEAAHQPGMFPRPVARIRGPMSPRLLAGLPDRCWLLTGELPGPVAGLVPGSRVLSQEGVDPGIMLYHLELRPAAAGSPAGPSPAAIGDPATRPAATAASGPSR